MCSFYYDFKKTDAEGVGETTPRSIQQLEFKITGDLFEKLLKLSTGSSPRLHMILTAGIIALLNQYTGMEDIVIGAPIYKQKIETEFINTVLVLKSPHF